MADITQTDKLGEQGWTMGRNPKAIEAQEAQGQRELAQSSQLPIKGIGNLPPEWGIKIIGDPVDGSDPLFRRVFLPEGWKIVPTDHSMWSDLVSPKGSKVASIFYKAAYYDRSAHITFNCRYSVRKDYAHADQTKREQHQVIDNHTGAVLFTTDDIEDVFLSGKKLEPWQYDEHRGKQEVMMESCRRFLHDNFPNWQSPSAYWEI